jgi:hypothetical protein
MTKSEWVMSFVEELQRLRPHITLKLGYAIGLVRHGIDAKQDPKTSAQVYVKSNPN